MAKRSAPKTTAERCDPPHGAKGLPAIAASPAAIDAASRIFKALGDPSRLRLLTRLADAPACVTDLAAAEGESLPTMSQRIRVLRGERLVSRHRQGRHITYQLADDHVLALVRAALDHAGERRVRTTP